MSAATMRQENFILLSQRCIAADVYEMKLAGDCSAITAPGQFVNISVPGFFLHRPISVAHVERGAAWQGECGAELVDTQHNDILTLIYKVVGQGTAALAAMQDGAQLEMLVGLGNGYSLPDCKDSASQSLLLVGGGVGVPPLYWLARQLRARGHNVQVILGFNSACDVFYEQEFEDLGCAVTVTTADGSYGMAGFVTAAMPDPNAYSYFYTCGPIPMLKAVAGASGITCGEMSFEERMGCGFGACMGCSHRVKKFVGLATPQPVEQSSDAKECSHGISTADSDTSDSTSYSDRNDAVTYKRICVEGPVLRKEEILWN